MLKIVFFGTPRFAAHVLEKLIAIKANIVAVVTKPDRPQGRSQKIAFSPVKTVALAHQVALYQPLKASAPEFVEELKKLNADLYIVVAYSEIFKENLLQAPNIGCVNVHASLLPKYRGAAPIHRSIMNGDSETGVTIMWMAKELDAGEILSVAKTPITEEMTTSELTEILSEIGGIELIKVLEQFEENRVLKTPQDHAKVTYAAKVTSTEAQIDWNKPAQIVHNHIRGLTHKPGAWCTICVRKETKRLLIKKTEVEPHLQGLPGHIFQDQKGLVIACGDGAIKILELQLEGKKSLEIEEFLRGFSKKELQFI